MDRVTLTGLGLVATLVLGLSAAGAALAETVTVHPSPSGQYFAKLICDAGTCEGTGYRATAADSNLALWRARSIPAGRITLSDDGELMVSQGGSTLTLYIGGQQVGTLAGGTAIASIARDSDGIVLVTSRGEVMHFVPVQPEPVDLLPAEALPAEARPPVVEPRVGGPRIVGPPVVGPPKVGPGEDAPQAPQQPTVDAPAPAVPTPGYQAPVVAPVLPAAAQPVGGRAAPTLSPAPAVPGAPASTAGASYRCEVNAVMRSGRRVSIVQQGPSAAVATDRAMAYCEGMVGAGSRSPAGTCEMLACQELKD